MDSTRVGQAIFLLGVLAGMLTLLIAEELTPERRDSTLAQFDEIKQFTRTHFVREISDEELLDRALHGMIDGLDPYSRYYDPGESEGVRRETDGDFKGVGVIFRRPVAGGQVLFPLPGTPAFEAGIRVGDTILSVDDASIDGLGEEEFRRLLRADGKAKLDVRLKGLDGTERSLTLRPRTLVDPTVRHERIVDPARGIAYLCIRSFTHQTAAEFDSAVERLRARGATALVIDLRGNYGGVLDAAVNVARRFVAEGPIVSSEGRVERFVYDALPGAARYSGIPVVVLVDEDSASASEVLAGSLQDHRVAAVVGAPTYGKGMLQTIRAFPRYGKRAKVTSGYYYSPSRRNFERTAEEGRDFGILPDLHVPIPAAARRRVLGHLARYDPPDALIGELAAWEREAGVPLLGTAPEDVQLDAALGLLRGERPGPEAVAGEG